MRTKCKQLWWKYYGTLRHISIYIISIYKVADTINILCTKIRKSANSVINVFISCATSSIQSADIYNV